MRYVIEEVFDDLHQECTNTEDCDWRGGPYDEPWTNCPRCSSRLRKVGLGA